MPRSVVGSDVPVNEPRSLTRTQFDLNSDCEQSTASLSLWRQPSGKQIAAWFDNLAMSGCVPRAVRQARHERLRSSR